MCVVDKERDVILLGRGARHPANMYSCLAGFTEVGAPDDSTDFQVTLNSNVWRLSRFMTGSLGFL